MYKQVFVFVRFFITPLTLYTSHRTLKFYTGLNGHVTSKRNSQRGSPSPVLVGMLEQVPPDRIHTAQNSNRIRAVSRRKWSKDDNRIAMECFIRSKPENRGYRRRMISIWQDRVMFEISEQRLADQVKQSNIISG